MSALPSPATRANFRESLRFPALLMRLHLDRAGTKPTPECVNFSTQGKPNHDS